MPIPIKNVGNFVPKYESGLGIAADAYSAVNKENIVTSSEYFYYNPVGVYDTVKGEWVNIKDINDLDSWRAGLEGKPSEWKDRYSVAFGTDKDNIDGFMNIDDFVSNLEAETTDIDNNPNANGDIAQYTDTSTSVQASSESDKSKEEIKFFQENTLDPLKSEPTSFFIHNEMAELEQVVKKDVLPLLETPNFTGNYNINFNFNGHDAYFHYNNVLKRATIEYEDNGQKIKYIFDKDGNYISSE